MAEAQYLFHSEMVSAVSGLSFFRSDREFTYSGMSFPSDEVRFINIYLYSHIDYPKKVTWTFGISGDFFEGDQRQRIHQSKNRYYLAPGFLHNNTGCCISCIEQKYGLGSNHRADTGVRL